MALALGISSAASAQALSMGKTLPFYGKLTKSATVMKGARPMEANLVTPPATATVETNWAITGSYINQGTAYTNENPISVAFDNNEVYIQGLSFLCPTGWVKGTIDGTTATFASTQYVGQYYTDSIFVCGTADGNTLGDLTFNYDAQAQSFTLSNYYVENASSTTVSPYFYSTDIVINTITPVPTDLTAEPTATTANVTWTESGEATSWNLRYRTVLEPENLLWDFESEDQLADWSLLDNDGDNNNWYYGNSSQLVTNSGTGILTSASYAGGALTPDNWLITPAITLGGKVSFYACAQDPSYSAEVFAVYVCTGEPTSINDFVQLGSDITATSAMTKYEFDLSEYEGEGHIAFRHYNCTDQFRLNLDDVAVEVPGGQWPSDWTVVEGVTNPYTIEGLTPETMYEVQVQAIGTSSNSDWTASTRFTTLADETPVTGYDKFYLVGTFTEWLEGTAIEFEEVADGVYEAKADIEAGGEFKVITPVGDNWKWFGGVDETQVGYYLITEELLNTPTPLIDGANFHMQDAGVYIIRVTEAQTSGIKTIQEPLEIQFIYYAPTAVETINTTNTVDNTWYNLQGVKFNGKPAAAGIYINGGKKVIIK